MGESVELETRFDVAPAQADWYFCAIIDRHGETDYVDGYASGARPTRTALQDHKRCRHSWVAGMMHVHDEDVESVAATRAVTCDKCDCRYVDRNARPFKIIEWEVKRTPRGLRLEICQPNG
jgi:hypothetical protein